jgi:hypothetical protein
MSSNKDIYGGWDLWGDTEEWLEEVGKMVDKDNKGDSK